MIERKVSTHIPVGPVNKMLVLTVVRFGRVVIFEKVWMSQISYKGTSIYWMLSHKEHTCFGSGSNVGPSR